MKTSGQLNDLDFGNKTRDDGVKLENDGKLMKQGVKAKFQDTPRRSVSNVSNKSIKDENAKRGWNRGPKCMEESAKRDDIAEHQLKSEVFDSPKERVQKYQMRNTRQM